MNCWKERKGVRGEQGGGEGEYQKKEEKRSGLKE